MGLPVKRFEQRKRYRPAFDESQNAGDGCHDAARRGNHRMFFQLACLLPVCLAQLD
jgi:hypothetical protein